MTRKLTQALDIVLSVAIVAALTLRQKGTS